MAWLQKIQLGGLESMYNHVTYTHQAGQQLTKWFILLTNRLNDWKCIKIFKLK